MALKPAIHGRDHCPNGSDPIPCLPAAGEWAYLTRTADFTMISGTSYNPFTASTTGATSDSSAFTADTTNGRIHILTPGIYVAAAGMNFATSFAAQRFCRLSFSDIQVAPWGDGDTDKIISETGGNITAFDLYFIQVVSGGDDFFSTLFQQASGSDKTFNSGSLKVVKLSNFP